MVRVEVPCDDTATTLIAFTLINIFFVVPIPPAGVTFAQIIDDVTKVLELGAFDVGADTPVKNASLSSVILLLLNIVVILVSADPVPSTRNWVFFNVLEVGVAGDQEVPLHLKFEIVLADMLAGLLQEITGVLLQ